MRVSTKKKTKLNVILKVATVSDQVARKNIVSVFYKGLYVLTSANAKVAKTVNHKYKNTMEHQHSQAMI